MVSINVFNEGGYPKEDKCKYCGEHLGFILELMGEMVALGCCDKPECKEKEKNDRNKGK